jgi:hypothetical protein
MTSPEHDKSLIIQTQALTVKQALEESLTAERTKQTQNLMALSAVMNSKILLKDFFRRQRINILNMATFGLLFKAKNTQINRLSRRLCDPSIQSFIIDYDTHPDDPFYVEDLQIFRYVLSVSGEADVTENIVEVGKHQANSLFLKELSDEKLLGPYSLDVARFVLDLNRTPDNKGFVGSLPTKVDRVTAEYLYPDGQQDPQVSIQIAR